MNRVPLIQLLLFAAALVLTGCNSDQPDLQSHTQDPAIGAPVPINVDPSEDFTEYVNDPIFIGAQGFGVYTPAGSRGEVCLVSHLGDVGEHSLRWCIEQKWARQVEFGVSGTIFLQSTLVIEHPYISILGQSAAGSGITLRLSDTIDGPVIRVATNNVLIQHLKIRPGPSVMLSCCRDGIVIGDSEPNQVYNVVIDHNSISWATDELIDIWFDSRDITISNNILSEGLHRSTNESGPAGRGLHIGDNARTVSVHHNLFSHTYQRNPGVFGSSDVDIVNNIIYHWVGRGTEIHAKDYTVRANLVGNLYIAHGPEQLQPSATPWYDVELRGDGRETMSVYFEGNIGYWRRGDTDEQWALAGTGWEMAYSSDLGWHSQSPFPAPDIHTQAAIELPDLLEPHVGASLPQRDTIDKRILQELRFGTGYMPDCVEGCELDAGGWVHSN